ncbi:hypothetical protein JKP88DRAFT_252111 [Tribonema minus]|uniref:Uncharacterized protein n=1 Tax=Tribonema minus TaxID=303371 RepID=A0A835ZCR9_9STRA|nr:hypothetical protein JKP88DRAFT_252111 [Tribonema minus]
MTALAYGNPVATLPQGPASSRQVRSEASQLLHTIKGDSLLSQDRAALLAYLRDATDSVLLHGDTSRVLHQPQQQQPQAPSPERLHMLFDEQHGELRVHCLPPSPQARAPLTAADSAVHGGRTAFGVLQLARRRAEACLSKPPPAPPSQTRQELRQWHPQSPSGSSASHGSSARSSPQTSPSLYAEHAHGAHMQRRHDRSGRARHHHHSAPPPQAPYSPASKNAVRHKHRHGAGADGVRLQSTAPATTNDVLRGVFKAAAAAAASGGGGGSSGHRASADALALMAALLRSEAAWEACSPSAIGGAACRLRALGAGCPVSWREFFGMVTAAAAAAAAAAPTTARRRGSRPDARRAYVRGGTRVLSDAEEAHEGALDLSNCHAAKLERVLGSGAARHRRREPRRDTSE